MIKLQGAYLLVEKGMYEISDAPHEKSTVTFGRYEDRDVQFSDTRVSRSHAEIREEGGSFRIMDTGTDGNGSKHGTFVDNESVSNKGMILQDGARITFSNPAVVSMTFHIGNSPGVLSTEPPKDLPDILVRRNPNTVWLDGIAVKRETPLSDSAFDIIFFLYENRGEVYSLQKLADEALGNLGFNTTYIRQLIGEIRLFLEPSIDSKDSNYIRNKYGLGYYLVQPDTSSQIPFNF